MHSARDVDAAVLKKALHDAVRRLYDSDAALLHDRSSEPSVVFHVGRYLASMIDNWPGPWHVDVEYNRDHSAQEPMRKYLRATEGREDGPVLPDLIVHNRSESTPAANLLVVEAKHTPTSADRSFDYAKLRGFREAYDYRITAFLEFPQYPAPARCMWIDAADRKHIRNPNPSDVPDPLW